MAPVGSPTAPHLLVPIAGRGYQLAMDLTALGKVALWVGLGIAALGLVFIALGKAHFQGLPGDLSFKLGNVRVFVPLATSLLKDVPLDVFAK